MRNLLIQRGSKTLPDTFKVDFFTKIFFSTEKKGWKWRAIFHQHFPTVSAYISFLKKEDHALAAISLQKQEACILIEDALTTLYDRNIRGVFVLHDALYCLEEHISLVEQALLEAYKRVGVQAQLKVSAPTDALDKRYVAWLESQSLS
jgi:hypothetical protein